jgi:hypothetical protein
MQSTVWLFFFSAAMKAAELITQHYASLRPAKAPSQLEPYGSLEGTHFSLMKPSGSIFHLQLFLLHFNARY